MASKAEKEKLKLIQDKCQTILNDLLRDEDNKYCVDCDSKGPRWASWNLGIFLCIRCAGIHRNLGVHISKVKSVNLDSWTPEQVVTLQQMGNSRARAVYEANLPDSFRRPQHDSSLEAFIRAKYEQKKYIAKEWVPPVIPKVNWDKEIEESRKKKDGKRKTSGNISLPTPELHALPKPKSPNSTPKPIRAAAMISALESAEKKSSSSSAAVDLLGLDAPSPSSTIAQSEAGDDIFTSFLSAPAADATQADSGKRSKEEDSFFNQPAAQDKKPLTKDSIMALYSQGGTQQQQQQQPQQPVFGVQGGIFAPQGFQSVQPPANVGFPAVSNLHSMPQNGMFAGAIPNMGMTSNPFFATGMPTSAPGLPGVSPSGFQSMPMQEPSQDLMSDFASFATQQIPPPSQQLPQQMSRMNLGGAQPAGLFGSSSNNGHTLSTNLWQ